MICLSTGVSSYSRPAAHLTEGGPETEAHGAASNDVEGVFKHTARVPHRHQLCDAGDSCICVSPSSAEGVKEMHGTLHKHIRILKMCMVWLGPCTDALARQAYCRSASAWPPIFTQSQAECYRVYTHCCINRFSGSASSHPQVLDIYRLLEVRSLLGRLPIEEKLFLVFIGKALPVTCSGHPPRRSSVSPSTAARV